MEIDIDFDWKGKLELRWSNTKLNPSKTLLFEKYDTVCRWRHLLFDQVLHDGHLIKVYVDGTVSNRAVVPSLKRTLFYRNGPKVKVKQQHFSKSSNTRNTNVHIRTSEQS